MYSMHENDFVFYSTKNNNENSNTFEKIKPANECTKLSFPGLINNIVLSSKVSPLQAINVGCFRLW